MDFKQKRIGDAVVVTPPAVKVQDFASVNEGNTLLEIIINETDATGVLVDLKNVQYVGTAFLSMLVCADIRAKKAGKCCVICSVSERIYDLIRKVQLHTVLTICSSRAEALEAMKSGEDG